MCLTLKSTTTRAKIAKEDVVCYKRIIPGTKRTWIGLTDGQPFKGTIKGLFCEGHVSIENGFIYFCTDERYLDGDKCSHRKGHFYSWVDDDTVTEIEGATLEINKWQTPYQHTVITIGKTYSSKLLKWKNEVDKGLHSFATLKAARKDGEGKYVKGKYVKCIIPKGSRYYEGTFRSDVSYASTLLKYVEIVE